MILDEVYKESILGYVKKDSPLNQYIASKGSLKKLKQLISGKDCGLDRRYLKDIWQVQSDILKLNLVGLTTKEHNQIEHEVKSVFDVLNSNIAQSFVYAMYSIFKCLELIANKYIEERGQKAYWKEGGLLRLYVEDRIPLNIPLDSGQNNKFTANKIHMVAYEKFGIKDNEVHNQIDLLVCSRNYSIHPEAANKIFCKNKTIKHDHIFAWFNIVCLFLSKLDNRA